MVVRRKTVAKPVLPPLKHQPSVVAGVAAPVMAQAPRLEERVEPAFSQTASEKAKPPVIEKEIVVPAAAPAPVQVPVLAPVQVAPVAPVEPVTSGGLSFEFVDDEDLAPAVQEPVPQDPMAPVPEPVPAIAASDLNPAIEAASDPESVDPAIVESVVIPPVLVPAQTQALLPTSPTEPVDSVPLPLAQKPLAPIVKETPLAQKGRARPPRLRRQASTREEHEDVTDADTTIGNEVRVLSGDDGEFKLPQEVQSILCYLSDGRVLVSKSHRTDARVRAFIARLENIKRAIRVLYVDLSVVELAYQSAKEVKAVETFNESDMQQAAYALFSRAADEKASDIHVRVSETDNTQIYLRIIGDMEMIEEHPYDYGHAMILAIYQAMTDQADATFTPNAPQDARIGQAGKLPRALTGIRVATLPQVGGNVMILRLLYKDTRQTSDLSELGFSESQVEAFTRLRRRTTGIIFNSGPTGAGKSTTLQRALTGVIQETDGRKNIITVEDPPEYPIQGAVQVPVTNADSEEERNKQFQTAIRAALRSDPDIMMIGEIRDEAAAKLAIASAMTGHPTWTSIHANSALDIFDRLMDMGVHLNKMTSHTVISGLIAQRLVKVLCPHCRETIQGARTKKLRDPEEFERILSFFQNEEAQIYLRGAGCDVCNDGQPGYIGRTLIAEVLETDKEFMRLIRKGDREGAQRHWVEQGGVTLEMHAREKVLAGLIDPFDAEEEIQWTHPDVQESAH